MIASGTTISHQRPPYIYGEILSRSVYETESSELPRFGRFISQGAAAGAVMAFVFALIGVLSRPTNGNNYVNCVFIFLLPFLLVAGMVLGLLEGVVIWTCTRLARTPLNPAIRAGIGIVTLAIIGLSLYWIVPSSPRSEVLTFADYLSAIVVEFSIAIVCGLVSGSRLQPWRELVRGVKTIPSQARILTGTTGVILRGLVIWFLMESTLAIVCLLQEDNTHELTFTLIALLHFAAALVILLVRVRFWLLVPLVLLVNIPVVVLLTHVVQPDALLERCVLGSYLGLWAAFLITRCTLTYSALSFLKEEFRYYLID